ncbi:MAG: AMP-binding protein [Hyphomicrobiaceae bacterium]|nr:AMP-binding protein [Hyphomicrobiaceae bacterium]
MFRKLLSHVRPLQKPPVVVELTPRRHVNAPLGPSGHVDTFARDHLPPFEQWPDLLLDRAEFQYPDYLNVAVELTDGMVSKGFGDHTALIGNGRQRTYKELSDWTNRLAHALVEVYGLQPGNRVLIRSPNSPAMVACWLAATKAGAVVVNTMPMLRAGELSKIIDKAEISLALCDTRLMDELVACAKDSRFLKHVVSFDGTANHDAELDRVALNKPVRYTPVKTGRDDVALLGFTSGTTGEPKATMHFHRDLLIIADGYAREVLGVTPNDVFVGSPPLAFTFGLGGLAIFPLRFGAAAALLENASPQNLIALIQEHRATVCFTAPTAYRVMLNAMEQGADLSSLRAAVSAGETLPSPVYYAWIAKTGKPMLDGIGATELLHIFISNRFGDSKAACTGKPVTGYDAKVVDGDMREVPVGDVGRLAVRGPTGCRYLADERQRAYVIDGWNITGDSFMRDADGYFHFAARNDDMIISAGYNIAGPEVEAALLAHGDVAECAVIGSADEDRGQIVEAHVVLKPGVLQSDALTKLLQDHVKATIAPYKYPRRIVFRDELPKTQTGKIQRFKLRDTAQ